MCARLHAVMCGTDGNAARPSPTKSAISPATDPARTTPMIIIADSLLFVVIAIGHVDVLPALEEVAGDDSLP